jgi:methylenetetrahydrofolate dehydrogenase (NADP+)/methenyltetrahydrofolate cyclohydrolase
MVAFTIDGKAVAQGLRQQIAADVKKLNFKPGLAVVLVGENPASQVYVRNKSKAADEVGMQSWTHVMPATATQLEVLMMVDRLNKDPAVHGILVQLPLPPHIDENAIINAINPAKDVDGFHPMNAGKMALGLPSLVPCTPQGCLVLLKEVLGNLAGRKALVIGRSNIVGKPLANLLIQADCTVTVAHSRTRNLQAECRTADIVVAAVGKAEFVKGDWIQPGAVVIDVGINRVDDPKNPGKTMLVGDVEFERAAHFASAITPVPGGVGPMTIACLLRNTLQAAKDIQASGKR